MVRNVNGGGFTQCSVLRPGARRHPVVHLFTKIDRDDRGAFLCVCVLAMRHNGYCVA